MARNDCRRRFLPVAALAAAGFFIPIHAAAAEPAAPPPQAPRKLAVGVNYLGGQLRWSLTPRWAAELRYQSGRSSSDNGTIKAQVFGLRGYRFFPIGGFDFLLGLEAARVNASQVGGPYNAGGFAFGGFGGLEKGFGRRFALGLDAGPYIVNLHANSDSGSRVSDSSVEIVADTYLLVRLF